MYIDNLVNFMCIFGLGVFVFALFVVVAVQKYAIPARRHMRRQRKANAQSQFILILAQYPEFANLISSSGYTAPMPHADARFTTEEALALRAASEAKLLPDGTIEFIFDEVAHLLKPDGQIIAKLPYGDVTPDGYAVTALYQRMYARAVLPVNTNKQLNTGGSKKQNNVTQPQANGSYWHNLIGQTLDKRPHGQPPKGLKLNVYDDPNTGQAFYIVERE